MHHRQGHPHYPHRHQRGAAAVTSEEDRDGRATTTTAAATATATATTTTTTNSQLFSDPYHYGVVADNNASSSSSIFSLTPLERSSYPPNHPNQPNQQADTCCSGGGLSLLSGFTSRRNGSGGSSSTGGLSRGGNGNKGGNRNNNNGSSNSITDADLAQEMNELSVQERNLVYDEIHGVTEFQPESDEFLNDKMKDMDVALSKFPRNRLRKAWDRAKFLRPGLITDTKFKLMFLRADYYDGTKAAKRLVKYYDDKLKLFGEEKLVKKITIQDLSETDIKVFHDGFYQVLLSNPDNSGRPVWFIDLSKYNFEYCDSIIRCTWYIVMATLELEAAQMKGVVVINYWPGRVGFNPSMIAKFTKTSMKVGDMIINLPIRESSYHFCFNAESGMEFAISAIRKGFGKHIRLRMREHYGSDMEIKYSLLPYGIDCPTFFFNTLTGDSSSTSMNSGFNWNHPHQQQKMQYNYQYIQNRSIKDRAYEANHLLLQQQVTKPNEQQSQQVLSSSSLSSSEVVVIPYPQPQDVLVGRGCPYQNFSGNQMLSHIIDTQYLETYRTQPTDRFGRTCLFMDVVKTVQTKMGGRFLERIENKGWMIVSDKVARDKVSSAFRSKVQKIGGGTNSGGVGTRTSDDVDGFSSDDSRAMKRMKM